MRLLVIMELAEVKDDEDGSDRQSSSLSVSDSDATSSQDSEDSLELSESESITDVTPLNSPYCDSPLPQVKGSDYHGEDINVLTQAIRRLEVEQNEKLKAQSAANGLNCAKKKAFDSRRRVDTDSQRLLKHVVSQQGRVKSTSHERLHRRSTVINRSRLSMMDAGSPSEKSPPSAKASQKHVRHLKSLSHPSSSPYTYGLLENQPSCSQRARKTSNEEKPSSSALT